jgi:hypothetical protein
MSAGYPERSGKPKQQDHSAGAVCRHPDLPLPLPCARAEDSPNPVLAEGLDLVDGAWESYNRSEVGRLRQQPGRGLWEG